MTRTYSRSIDPVRGVPVLDWTLLERLEELFQPYVPNLDVGRYNLFAAEDHRGSYTAATAEELRREVERQEEEPYEVRLYVGDMMKREALRFDLGVRIDSHAATGLFISSSEETVVLFNTRAEELFEQSARRAGSMARAVEQHAPRDALRTESSNVKASVETPPFWMQHTVPLVVGITSTVVGGAILLLLFGH